MTLLGHCQVVVYSFFFPSRDGHLNEKQLIIHLIGGSRELIFSSFVVPKAPTYQANAWRSLCCQRWCPRRRCRPHSWTPIHHCEYTLISNATSWTTKDEWEALPDTHTHEHNWMALVLSPAWLVFDTVLKLRWLAISRVSPASDQAGRVSVVRLTSQARQKSLLEPTTRTEWTTPDMRLGTVD